MPAGRPSSRRGDAARASPLRARARPSRERLAPVADAGARGPIYAALAGDLAVAATKSAAAAWTGGSAMLSEAIHSAVDPGRLMKAYPGITRVFLRPSPPSTPPGP